MTEYEIKEMTVDDLDGVMEVERKSFGSFWPRKIFHQEIVHNSHAYYYILSVKGKIIGYVGMWVIMDDAQITNIAIIPEYRGKKYGEKLFAFAFQKAIHLGCTRLSLEVRESNVIAQNMYKKFGLVPGGIRKRYYTDNQEDAIVMWVNFK